MNQLLQIGFAPCGHWSISSDRLACDLSRFATLRNILYAFVVDGELMYVGKTVQPLATRMAGYRNPAPSQTTNVRNNARVKQALASGAVVEIFALPDTGLHRYGDFHLNLAAGLEDDIIRVMRPPWNGGEKERPETAAPAIPERVELPVQSSFELALAPTYYRKGFFNVPVAQTDRFASDGETIELYLGAAPIPVLGTINRRANANQTPRIIGGVELRDWFQRTGTEGGALTVEVLSPNSVRLLTR
jgi:hypothetical protein